MEPDDLHPNERPSATEVYRAYAADVSRWVRRLAGPGPDVEDMVHDVFLVALRRLNDFDPTRASLRTWLFGVAVKVVQGRRRRERLRTSLSRWLPLASEMHLLHTTASMPEPGEALEEVQRQRLLYALLDEIGENYRTVLVLFEIEELSGEQIAAITGTSVRNVWLRVHRARKKLAACWAKRMQDGEGFPLRSVPRPQ